MGRDPQSPSRTFPCPVPDTGTNQGTSKSPSKPVRPYLQVDSTRVRLDLDAQCVAPMGGLLPFPDGTISN